MLIEIHMIQNHSPANLNRDDLGAPKTCIFGGATRARISSQCLKRSIRRSTEFSAALEKDGGVRTRRLANLLARVAHAGDFELTPEKLAKLLEGNPIENEETKKLDAIAARALELGGVKPKSKQKGKSAEGGKADDDEENAEALSKMLLFLSTTTIAKMAQDLKEESDTERLAEKFKKYIAENPRVPDIALNGRMTEVAKNSVFSDLNFTVEAALSAAHAISTHAVVNEVDYFTAADDVPGQDAGAAHINEGMFNSACFYKHFVIDFEQLKKNLANESDLACKTVRCFLEAAAKANPSGKQHAYAAFNPPDGVLVEVKTKSATPVSYANAFADPVPEKSERGLIGESIARLGQYTHDLVVGYGIEAKRFWFSPNLRHRLTWIDKSTKEQEQSVVGSNEFGEFDQFVHKVMGATGTPAEAAK
ncbi:putative CRISPR system Cascade subunit CasC [uncultured Desulfobacterium sp.]|uniref:Putative CRISPR system Cascade subunit CasC n=1 Tax=uncultured Desulfobacterium sp. TaxID=201089 RepID=A0A445N0K0_9BACT|nr:putative CRISPR system Cascade subunit CasC [uncultured Desulfobacterium sp.]